jgi:hypothetical protein
LLNLDPDELQTQRALGLSPVRCSSGLSLTSRRSRSQSATGTSAGTAGSVLGVSNSPAT